MELCSMLCGSLDGRGVWERMDACLCLPESLHCLPESITTLFVKWLFPNTKFKTKEIWDVNNIVTVYYMVGEEIQLKPFLRLKKILSEYTFGRCYWELNIKSMCRVLSSRPSSINGSYEHNHLYHQHHHHHFSLFPCYWAECTAYSRSSTNVCQT